MKKFALAIVLGLFSNLVQATHFSQDHTLIFIYESHCPYCQQMAPVVKAFSEISQISLSPASMDNQPIAPFDYFDVPKPALLQAVFANQAVEYPALFILNRKTRAIYPVSIGALSLDELTERMGVLIPKIELYEQREA